MAKVLGPDPNLVVFPKDRETAIFDFYSLKMSPSSGLHPSVHVNFQEETAPVFLAF